MICRLLKMIIYRYEQLKARKWLKRQKMLIGNGIGFRTKLLDVIEKSHPINDYVLICIQARLRVKGKIICRRVQTLLREGDLPQAGDIVNIRYMPHQLKHVLLLDIQAGH